MHGENSSFGKIYNINRDFPGGPVVKNPPANAGDVRDMVWSLDWEGEHGNPLQYSCLENSCCQRSLAGYSPLGHQELDMTFLT